MADITGYFTRGCMHQMQEFWDLTLRFPLKTKPLSRSYSTVCLTVSSHTAHLSLQDLLTKQIFVKPVCKRC